MKNYAIGFAALLSIAVLPAVADDPTIITGLGLAPDSYADQFTILPFPSDNQLHGNARIRTCAHNIPGKTLRTLSIQATVSNGVGANGTVYGPFTTAQGACAGTTLYGSYYGGPTTTVVVTAKATDTSGNTTSMSKTLMLKAQ